jgi:hypothetical protein
MVGVPPLSRGCVLLFSLLVQLVVECMVKGRYCLWKAHWHSVTRYYTAAIGNIRTGGIKVVF